MPVHLHGAGCVEIFGDGEYVRSGSIQRKVGWVQHADGLLRLQSARAGTENAADDARALRLRHESVSLCVGTEVDVCVGRHGSEGVAELDQTGSCPGGAHKRGVSSRERSRRMAERRRASFAGD